MRLLRQRPTAAFVVALIALFVALGGTAGAVVTAAVPLAKRALMADNAKKVNGLTATQIATAGARAGAALPGPASTATGLVVIKSQSAGQLAVDGPLTPFDVACDSGKVIGGGISSDGAVVTFDSFPKTDTTWEVVGANLGSAIANVTAYAICLK